MLNVVHPRLLEGPWNSKYKPAKENIFAQYHCFFLFTYRLCLFVNEKPGLNTEFLYIKGVLKHHIVELDNPTLILN